MSMVVVIVAHTYSYEYPDRMSEVGDARKGLWQRCLGCHRSLGTFWFTRQLVMQAGWFMLNSAGSAPFTTGVTMGVGGRHA